MFCPKCGKELKPGAKFCNGCGASLGETPQAALDNRSQKPKKGKGAVTALLLVLAVLLLLGGGAVAAYKLNLFDSLWNPSSEKIHADKDKDDKDMDEDDETGEKESDEDDETDERGSDAADEGDSGDALGKEGAKEARDEKHTKINDLSGKDEAATTSGYPAQASGYPAETAASGYPAQAAASGYPAETTGAAQAYSDFTAPGVGSGAAPETAPVAAAAGSDGSYMTMYSSSRRLTASDLYGLSKEQLKIARNEIYARHGRLFDSESLQFYFNSKSWYHGTIAPSAFSEDLLSQVEKDNIKLIKEREASMP